MIAIGYLTGGRLNVWTGKGIARAIKASLFTYRFTRPRINAAEFNNIGIS